MPVTLPCYKSQSPPDRISHDERKQTGRCMAPAGLLSDKYVLSRSLAPAAYRKIRSPSSMQLSSLWLPLEELEDPEEPDELEEPEDPDELEDPDEPEELDEPDEPEELEEPDDPEELEDELLLSSSAAAASSAAFCAAASASAAAAAASSSSG